MVKQLPITYEYSYANISSVGRVSDVTVRNIATTNTNYTVEPTYLENQNGTVNNRTIKSIAISDPTKNEYNYSDTFDPTGNKVTVTYDGETDSVDYDWNAVPDDITLKWTGTEEHFQQLISLIQQVHIQLLRQQPVLTRRQQVVLLLIN